MIRIALPENGDDYSLGVVQPSREYRKNSRVCRTLSLNGARLSSSFY
jgi:hypothetical protein